MGINEDGDGGRWESIDASSLGSALGVAEKMYYTASANKRGNPVNMPWITNGTGESNSEIFLRKQNQPTGMTLEARKKLSATRQDYLDELGQRAKLEAGRPELGAVSIARGQSLYKTASSIATTSGLLPSHSNSTHIGPEVYSPLFLTANLQLPRDRITANAWNRAFYETNPIVRNAINLHATYPISKMSIKCDDKKVEKFFMDMADRIDLETVVQQVALEFFKIGEAFVYASFDEQTGCWDNIYLHNPDYIRVKASPIPTKAPQISLRPDPELQRLVTSNDPEAVRMREQIDPRVLNHVIRNEYIPLDSFNISHLKNLASPYEVRGTSTIVSVWKDLMLYDKLRECKLTQADAMVNPLTLVKIGTDGPDGFYPRQEELEAWRSMLEQAQYDKDFKIVTHNAVDIKREGFTGAVLDVQADFNFIVDNILMGLMIPKSILTQEGASYASASVALDVLRQRYNSFRTMMANWLEKKIFAPISEVQEFYDLDSGQKRLIVPTIEWNHMTLYDMDNYIAQISTLVEKGRVSQRTLDRSLGLTRTNELVNIREELIEQAMLMQEKAALSKMTLAQLRALNPEDPIVEPETAKLPGQPGGPGTGGGMGGDMMGGLGGMPGGGMPPMPGGDMFGGGGGGFGGGLGGGGGLPPLPDLGAPPAGGGGLGAIPGGSATPTPPPV